MTRIRVLVVDDSATVRGRLSEILGDDPEFEVVGQAADGRSAIAMCVALRPDVMTLDLVLPELNGFAVTEHIMAHAPTPILIVSSSFNRGEIYDTYQALAAGAVDVLDKAGDGDVIDDDWARRFINAVRMVSRIKVITHPRGRLGVLGHARRAESRTAELTPITAARDPAVIALGASTGGPGALADVLRAIPNDVLLPMLVVLHIDAAFAPSFAEWLGAQTGRPARCARDGDELDRARGEVIVAPPGRHLMVAKDRLRLVDAPPRHFCRPSIDTLFESLASELGPRAIACLLTGMGRDGAAGLLAIRRAGGLTLAQDEASSIVWGMPKEAMLLGAAERVLPLAEIGPAIAHAARRDRR